MTYKVFDLETETHQRFLRKANPFIPENYIVLRGWKNEGDRQCSWQYFNSKQEVTGLVIEPEVTILVGFNIKFDLLHEMQDPATYQAIKDFINRGGKIFDCQYAKYLVSGQQEKYQMCSMDSIIEEYGGRKKIDGIKELWQAGYTTSEIDKDMLIDYAVGTEEEGRNSGDIGNTELIYLGLLKEIEEQGMQAAVERRMDGLMATTEMEFNGLKIDTARAKADMADRMAELATVNDELAIVVNQIPEEVGFNWGSNVHVSCLLYGGTIRYKKQDVYLDETTGELSRYKATERWPLFDGEPVDPTPAAKKCQFDEGRGLYWRLGQDQDTYLSGKKKGEGKFKNVSVQGELKVKYQDFFYTLDGMIKPDDEWKGALTDGLGGPVYSSSGEVIDKIGIRVRDAGSDMPFLKAFVRRADLSKELGTYYARYDEKKKGYVGMLTAVNPADCIVHHNLNHTSTVTTRLSSSSPNLQNLPRGDKSSVKAMFVSRFGDKGRMVEIDYSQLEVVVQGWLSGDKNLCTDLNNRVDFHCKRVASKFGISYEDALRWCKSDEYAAENPEDARLWGIRRTGVKEFSFQRAYGAGAQAISDATGLPKDEVEELIRLEDLMYPSVGEFNKMVEQEVNHTAEPFRDPQRGFRTFRRGSYQAPTGTLYSWRSWDAPAFLVKQGITDTFSPPELKNYPIQGTGGEVVQLVAGMLLRLFYRKNNFDNKAFLVNTVHDCFWFDCHEDVFMEVAATAKKVMESIPQFLKHFFNIDCPVPFPAEAEAGLNMLDLKHLSI